MGYHVYYQDMQKVLAETYGVDPSQVTRTDLADMTAAEIQGLGFGRMKPPTFREQLAQAFVDNGWRFG